MTSAIPPATTLTITADGGGSNCYRIRAWKAELARFASTVLGQDISATGRTGQVGIVIGVPIFEGGLTQSRVREAVALRD